MNQELSNLAEARRLAADVDFSDLDVAALVALLAAVRALIAIGEELQRMSDRLLGVMSDV